MQASVRSLCRQVSEIVIYLFIYLFLPFWHVLAVPDQDLKKGGGWSSRPLNKGGSCVQNNFVSAPRASV